ncbi:MAG: glutamine-hydrolyzing carbamoyl-phosphate synthase small subunit [Oscillospiraceae bacterium]|nr:glutamine-hydrolyzing carbamoyl-phosphate synthase small subunit [Oscillospiraceae bacterium]
MELGYNKKLIFEDGSEYYGYAFGDEGEKICEIVFNTSPVGYQEIVSDPSYTYQAVVMAYPLIGNYGIAADDFETETPTIGALIVRDYNDLPSNFRSMMTLSQVMKKYFIPGITGVDTRKLVRTIRDKGSRPVLITAADTPKEKGMELLKNYTAPRDAVSRVSTREKRYYICENAKYNVVAVDCGMKGNIPKSLVKRGCNVTAVPWNITADEVEKMNPDGIFLSNGPGDPTDVQPVIDLVRSLKGKYPIFGICLGHQVLSLAYGAKTYKLKFGHRGGNHPVKNLADGKIEITSQNHSYAVDSQSLKDTPLQVTHVNILDGTVEGVECAADMAFSVQYHPESCPGPQDSSYLFDKFIAIMEAQKNA